jgi:hypothetical protein
LRVYIQVDFPEGIVLFCPISSGDK